MRFNRNVPKENRDYLRAELKKYEAEFDDMTKAEKDALYKWVASGRSHMIMAITYVMKVDIPWTLYQH